MIKPLDALSNTLLPSPNVPLAVNDITSNNFYILLTGFEASAPAITL